MTRRGRSRGRGVLGVLGWLLVLLASLAVVTWRQTRGVERERALGELRAERAISEAERLELERRIQALSGRARVMRVARERLGMHLPSDAEIVLVPLVAEGEPSFSTSGRSR